MMSLLLALTSDQKLIFAVVALVLVVYILIEWWISATKDPPLPRSTQRLRKELERHKDDE